MEREKLTDEEYENLSLAEKVEYKQAELAGLSSSTKTKAVSNPIDRITRNEKKITELEERYEKADKSIKGRTIDLKKTILIGLVLEAEILAANHTLKSFMDTDEAKRVNEQIAETVKLLEDAGEETRTRTMVPEKVRETAEKIIEVNGKRLDRSNDSVRERDVMLKKSVLANLVLLGEVEKLKEENIKLEGSL